MVNPMSRTELKILGIIGARSGSVGVPDKNIRPLGGKPLLAWIIAAAKRSKYVNRVIVSTDARRYAEIAKQYGAEAPFLRPDSLAGADSPDIDYITHCLDWLQANEGYTPDVVVRLLATCPLQEPEDIDSCIQLLLDDPQADSAMVVAEARQHPAKALRLSADGYLMPYIVDAQSTATPLPRQRYEKAFFRANVVATRYTTLQTLHALTGSRVRGHCISSDRAVDIDTELDFTLAEVLLKKFGKI